MCHLPVLPYCVFVSAEWWPKKSLWKLQINRKLGILDYSTQDKDTASLPSLQESTAQLSYHKHCEWRKLGSNHWHLFSPCAVMFVPEMCSIHWSECACLLGFETGSWCVTHLGLGCCYLSLLSAEITSTYHCFGKKKESKISFAPCGRWWIPPHYHSRVMSKWAYKAERFALISQ